MSVSPYLAKFLVGYFFVEELPGISMRHVNHHSSVTYSDDAEFITDMKRVLNETMVDLPFEHLGAGVKIITDLDIGAERFTVKYELVIEVSPMDYVTNVLEIVVDSHDLIDQIILIRRVDADGESVFIHMDPLEHLAELEVSVNSFWAKEMQRVFLISPLAIA